jgi:ankyrin repeat protein
MPKPVQFRFPSSLARLRFLVPAWAVLGVALLSGSPFTLALFLAAAALAMTGICHALHLDMERSFRRSIARRGLACFVLLTGYTALAAILLAGPAWWLTRAASLPAALGMSVAALATMFSIWRLWPAFALPLLWDDAYVDDDRGSWLLTALQRSLAFAAHLTGEHPRIGYWLPASFVLLLLVIGALGLAGLGGFLPAEFRVVAVVLYGVLLLPLVSLVLVNRTLRALFAEARGAARRGKHDAAAEAPPPVPASAGRVDATEAELVALAADVPVDRLDATLVESARAGNIDLALAALARGARPDSAPPPDARDQRNALSLAVTAADLRLLRALIGKGLDLNRATPAALVVATRDSHEGRPEAVMTLLANGADPRVADADGNTPLHHAVRCAEPTVAALLLDAGAEVDVLNRDKLTPLGVACACANWPLVEFLLDRGAHPNIGTAQPPLLLAAAVADDDPAGVRLLLRGKAKIDTCDALGRSALHAAALAGHAHVAEALLGAGANPNLADRHATTPLMEAARCGATALVEALGKRKADCTARDAHGRSALVIACASAQSNEETVRALLAIGADPEATDKDGRRAVDHAAAAGRWHLVALLDAEYPLPSGFRDGAPPAESASADHLLDALRFDHWNVVEDFSEGVRDWPQPVLAGLYRALGGRAYTRARAWLLQHGLRIDARLDSGTPLADALLDDLPDSHTALADLLDRGAAIGGAGTPARVLAVAAGQDDPAPLGRLAASLLARGADPFGAWHGTGALHAAIAIAADDIVAGLLAAGVDPNARDAQGATPLHLALERDASRALPLVQDLLRHGADPEVANAGGETALGYALTRHGNGIAQWLDWRGWRPPRRPLRGADLVAAAAAGDEAAVERLLALGLPVESVDERGATALVRAAGAGHAALLPRLLAAGADSAHAADSGVTALAAAVSARREPALESLLENGVAADQRLPGGITPLMIAAGLGHTAIAKRLLQAGADANAVDEQGTTPLHAAARFAFSASDTRAALDLLELLLDSSARCDAVNHVGQNALLLVLGAAAEPGATCEARHIAALADLLLTRGAPLDAADQRGVGPLHACAMHGLLGAARALKSAGANLDQRDAQGRTPAEVANVLGYADVAAELGALRPAVPGVRQTLRRRVSE